MNLTTFRTTLVLGLVLTANSPTLLSQSFSESAIEEIMVVGARLPRSTNEVVGKIDVISHQRLTTELATSLSDVIRYTPGVSVTTADTRFGETEFSIRGLGGNRVATLIDGVPVPDQFDVGSFANAGQDFLVIDAISRIEILRGPASTLFGSDALGGVVAIVTRDPEEYLQESNTHLGGSVLYSGRDDSHRITGTAAFSGDAGLGQLAGVLHLSRKDGHEVHRTAIDDNDRQDRTQKSLQSKLKYTLPSGNLLRLNFTAFDEETDTDVESVLGYGRKFRNTTDLAGADSKQRYATTVGYEFSSDSVWLDQGRFNLYWQQVEVDQRTTEYRNRLNPPILNQRDFSYDTKAYGAILDLESSFSMAYTDHRIGWGVSVQRATIAEQRDGLTTNLQTGASSKVILGETFPVRDFPKSTVDEISLYVHDEISIGDFTLIPGLRYQSYELDANVDFIYSTDNPNTDIVDVSEYSLSPKLGLLWDVRSGTQLYLQYAHGFRAPPFEDVNIGFDIPLFNYRALPNPDLDAETSDGIELGARFQGDSYRAAIAVFGVDYDDLIETRVNLGRQPGTGTLLFQSRNVDEARVYGTEINFNADLGRWVEGVFFDASASWVRGKNRSNDEPLNTIDPLELVVALTWQPHERTRLAFVTTAVAAQNRVDDSSIDIIQTHGFTVFDMTASYTTARGIRVDAGVFNLFDRTYWRWSSVRNRTVDDPMLNHLSAPGRYASVSVRMDLW